MYGIFSSTGQSCIAGSRLFVARADLRRIPRRTRRPSTQRCASGPAPTPTPRSARWSTTAPRLRRRLRRPRSRGGRHECCAAGRSPTSERLPRRRVLPADGHRRAAQQLAHLPGGDLRPGPRGPAVRRRGRPGRAGQRLRLRAGLRHLDPRLPPRLAARPPARGRHRVDQHLQAVQHLHAVRRHRRRAASASRRAATRYRRLPRQKSLYWGLDEEPNPWA